MESEYQTLKIRDFDIRWDCRKRGRRVYFEIFLNNAIFSNSCQFALWTWYIDHLITSNVKRHDLVCICKTQFSVYLKNQYVERFDPSKDCELFQKQLVDILEKDGSLLKPSFIRDSDKTEEQRLQELKEHAEIEEHVDEMYRKLEDGHKHADGKSVRPV